MARTGIVVDGRRRRTICVVDECHRRASRTGRRPSQSSGQFLRNCVRSDGATTSHRRQPRIVGIAGRHQRLGQNTPAIATTEAHYAEMWAQDAAAMYGYAGSSAAASTLTPFADPPATTVGQATGAGTTLSQLVTWSRRTAGAGVPRDGDVVGNPDFRGFSTC